MVPHDLRLKAFQDVRFVPESLNTFLDCFGFRHILSAGHFALNKLSRVGGEGDIQSGR